MDYLLYTAIIFLVLGVLFFYIDSKQGIALNKWWFSITHKDDQNNHVEEGFVVGQTISSRLSVALFIAILYLVILVLFKTNPIRALFNSLVSIPSMILGFYIASIFIKRGPTKIKSAIDYVEKIEKGEVDLKKDIVKGATSLGKTLIKTTDLVKEEFYEAEENIDDTLNKEEEKSEEEEPEKKKGWRDGIDDFLNK